MKLRTRVASELNNPARWNQQLRPWFDVSGYQQRLNDRLGLNRDGLPIVVLRWGQDVWQRLWGEETPRYWLKRQKVGGKVTYWTVPRWIFEMRLEPGLYRDAWEKTRYSMRDPLEGESRCSDCGSSAQPVLLGNTIYCRRCGGHNIAGGRVVDKGPPPDEYFSFMMECAQHEATDPSTGWPACCTRAFYSDTKFGSPHSRCWGEYRPPTDDDMAIIVKAVGETKHNPYEPLTPYQLAETELAANKQVERAEEQFALYEQEIMADVTNRWLAQRVYSGAGGPGERSPAPTKLPLAIQNALAGIESPHS